MSQGSHRTIDVLEVDWRRLCRAAHPTGDGDGTHLEHELGIRAARQLGIEPPPDRLDPHLEGAARLAQVRRLFVHKAATIAVLRFDHLTGRPRFRLAAEIEERTYRRKLEQDRDVIPALKEEAKGLRAEVRALEARARDRGLDPDAIEPRVDWPATLAVDIYQRPEFETAAGRRARAVEFFRRLG